MPEPDEQRGDRGTATRLIVFEFIVSLTSVDPRRARPRRTPVNAFGRLVTTASTSVPTTHPEVRRGREPEPRVHHADVPENDRGDGRRGQAQQRGSHSSRPPWMPSAVGARRARAAAPGAATTKRACGPLRGRRRKRRARAGRASGHRAPPREGRPRSRAGRSQKVTPPATPPSSTSVSRLKRHRARDDRREAEHRAEVEDVRADHDTEAGALLPGDERGDRSSGALHRPR